MKSLWHAGRFGLAIVFLWAGIAKLLDPWAFQQSVERYQIVQCAIATIIAFTLPWLEVLAAICLAASRWVRGAMVLLALMLCMFLGALISAKMRGLDISCGCFGTGNGATLTFAIARAAILLALVGGTGYALRFASRLNESARDESDDPVRLSRDGRRADATGAAGNSAARAEPR